MSGPAPIIVLTGASGSGKTALCRSFAEPARAAGRDVAGILSPAVFRDGVKVGIEALDPRTGQTRSFASLRAGDPAQAGAPAPGLLMGPWVFDEAAVAWGNDLLRAATPCELLIVDELGSLEFTRGQGWLAGFDALDSGAYALAVAVVRGALVPAAVARWPRAEVLDAGDREGLERFIERLAPFLGPKVRRAMIALGDVSVRYGARAALDGVTLDVAPGESVLVSGPSGCGKSTLARLLAGLIPRVLPAHVAGHVRVAGLDPTRVPAAEMASHIGLVFQNPEAQLFCLTVEEEAAFGPRNLGLDEADVRERVAWALEATGLAGLRAHAPATLSGGQQQRLAIAAALAMRPPLLVLDEPLAGLDAPGVRQVLDTLAGLRREHGVTLLVIEHRMAEAARIADRVVLLDDGRVAADGPAAAVLGDDVRLRALGLRRPADTLAPGWADALRPAPPPADGAAVELRGVTAGYDGPPVLHDVDLALGAGEFAVLVGDNGCGKSTLARVLAGLMRPRHGSLRHAGGRRVRPGQDVGLLFQNPPDQLLTDRVDDEVALGPLNCGVFDRASHERTLAVADLVALRDRPPLALSAGQQQRTTLAATLALGPRLLILDEPTLGQDWGHLERLMELVVELNRRGSTVLLITHDHALVRRFARRVLVMRDGRIVADGTLGDPGGDDA